LAGLESEPGTTSGTGPAMATEPEPPADGTEAAASKAGPAPPPAAEAARLRFVADPWAQVSIDDGPSFLTPRARPVALTPGPHRVTFTHPLYGRAVVSLEVKPGEERVVSHVFEQADGR